MMRICIGTLALTCLLTTPPLYAQQTSGAQWIWTNEGEPSKQAPAATRYFRRVFTINRPVQKPVDEGMLDITADGSFTVWVNGEKVGGGSDIKRVFAFDVQKLLVHGPNVVAVEAKSTGGPAGLLVRLGFIPNGYSKLAEYSDASWKTNPTAAENWQAVDFDDSKWAAVRVIGPYGKAGPWKNLVWDQGGDDRFAVPLGFRVEKAALPPTDDPTFSLVNLTFDGKGRLLVSRERGPILLCSVPNKEGVLEKSAPYCTQVTNCQGMCWVKDALLLVGDGPQGTGLYRVQDTDNDDKTDKVTLLHKFKGGMAEHGPHAILRGPDGWLYVVCGNHAWTQIGPEFSKSLPNPEKLAANSPLTRWPTGGMGPDQGKPGTTEDVLLPRMNDGRGHAANILAPGGTIWRLDEDGKNMSLVAAGFRNHFDAAFGPHGELFTFDSDMEWDEALPWYRQVRVCHCPPGADFVWRTGAANTPDYYIDSLPPIAETGRGSPVGVEYYNQRAFPAKYRGALFLADWAIGVIFAVHLERDGASYKTEVERFCKGAPMNVTDLATGPDGALYFTMGGRGTQGGVYRIVNSVPQAERNIELDAKEVEALNRGKAIWDIGVGEQKDAEKVIIEALKDTDALVRRRACEALVRAGIEPPVDSVWPLLDDKDRFVRHAARLVLERIEPSKWAQRIGKERSDLKAWNAIVALCHMNKAQPFAEQIFGRLHGDTGKTPEVLLDWLRTVQLALVHVQARPIWVQHIATRCDKLFPQKDWRVNRELAILLTHFQREDRLHNVQVKFMKALADSKEDRLQQIHYFYCLRNLLDGWTPEQKLALAEWYEGTKSWRGGHSFIPFLENMFRETLAAFSTAERQAMLARGETTPLVSLVLAQRQQADRDVTLLPDLNALADRLAKTKLDYRADELKQAVQDAITQTALTDPSKETWAYLVSGLDSKNPLLRSQAMAALQTLKTEKPKIDNPAPFRALIANIDKTTNPKEQWQGIELLRHWTGRSFGAEPDQAKAELKFWGQWFGQTFPKEPALASLTGSASAESKYKLPELLSYLDTELAARKADLQRGKLIFEKAQCMKCHKFGAIGEGIGPDLSALSKRFKRADVLEALIHPSKVISDQYRSVTITTKQGQVITGLAAVQGDMVTVLLNDASKVSLKKDDIEQQFASLVSVMPERLLDTLERRDIVDLIAFLESEAK